MQLRISRILTLYLLHAFAGPRLYSDPELEYSHTIYITAVASFT